MEQTKGPGRPLDPAVGDAALDATRALLEENGYAGLRVADVARRAGIGLGALYRRWPDKRSLVLEALRGAVSALEVPESDDPVADLRRSLELLAEAFASRSRPLLATVISGTDPELAAVIREAKIVPLYEANRARLQRVVGDVPGLATRADIGPGLVLLDLLVRGRTPSTRRIRDEILPLMLEVPPADRR
ncbi:TetR/AcrR family transcriptional regulator [Solicola gregarius]|uniref:TetR/AcrR family transcriptional regulator n=1 Tax=Solicola gregarius TaxID=2908642 RepID=A0AA46TIX2_9ACTN|nr:TetR/AcrR family transcriptional regulator [Solicola gregarius]UYM05945.1 TetR/AcrR family transcriptional regulator [Solicola gregarius]